MADLVNSLDSDPDISVLDIVGCGKEKIFLEEDGDEDGTRVIESSKAQNDPLKDFTSLLKFVNKIQKSYLSLLDTYNDEDLQREA